jgi:hypothetical protein
VLLTTDQIDSLSQDLECGFNIYIHLDSKKITTVHDEMDIYEDIDEALTADELAYRDVVNDIENNPSDYYVIKALNSNESYSIMEKFIATKTNEKQYKIFSEAISNKKPFARFNHLIHQSPLREDWFAFRSQAYYKYVFDEIALIP